MSVTVQKIGIEVRIAGRVVPFVTDISTSSGFLQINSECTITATERPSWAEEGQEVTVWASTGALNGIIFSGELAGLDWSYTPGKVSIVCQDLLARTRLEWNEDDTEYEYASQDDAAVIRNLLEKMGIPSSRANIESSSWTLGTIEAIILKKGDVPYSIIEEIDKLAGYATYSDTHGNILRRRVSGIPGPSGALTFTKGVEILADARRNRSRVGIVNRCVVTGLTYEGLSIGGDGIGEFSAENPYVPNPPRYIGAPVQSNLVEDDAKALEIATRIVHDKNRRPEGLDFSIPLDPRVQPGMTVVVEHEDLETGTATVFVQSVSHSISSSGAKTTIRTTGGNLSGYALESPVASFSFSTFLEGEDTGSGVNSIIVAVCDGSASYDPDGQIASYAWTVSGTGATPAPTTGSESVFTFTISGAATQVVVTLTVTDGDGLTGSMPLTIPLDTSNMLVEDLYVVYGDVACSSDGEQTWRTAVPASGDATCLTDHAPAWGCAFGTSTGHIYATFDRLTSALIDLGAPHGAVACTALWCHELDTTRLWAGFSDGRVYKGVVDTTAHTAVWTFRGTIAGGSVVEVRESIGALNELRATAGAGYYYSANGGTSWSLVHTFDTARRMTAGFDTNLASGLNDAAPLYQEEAGGPPAVPGGVTHIRGLSFGWRREELYASDDAANLYLGAGPTFDLSLHADNADAQVNHMLRSGNIDRVVYLAIGDGTGTNNGFQKWIPGTAAPFYIRKTGSDAGLMLSYGAAHLPSVTAMLLIPTNTVASGGVWVGGPSGWTLKNSGLPTAALRWLWVSANPFNAREWLLLGADNALGVCDLASGKVVIAGTSSSPLWYTSDGGDNWSEVTLPLSTLVTSASGAQIVSVEWDDTRPNRWALLLLNTVSPHKTEWFWGTNGSANSVFTNTTSLSSSQVTIVGQSGDLVIAPHFSDAHMMYIADGTTALITPAGTVPPSALISFTHDRAPFASRAVALNARSSGTDRVLVTLDYRAAQPTDIYNTTRNDGAISLTWAEGGLYLVSATGSGVGIYRIASPLSGGSAEIAFDNGLIYDAIRSDRRTRSKIAALHRGTPHSIAYFDGASWTTFAGPSGGVTDIAAIIEVAI